MEWNGRKETNEWHTRKKAETYISKLFIYINFNIAQGKIIWSNENFRKIITTND